MYFIEPRKDAYEVNIFRKSIACLYKLVPLVVVPYVVYKMDTLIRSFKLQLYYQ